jgi:hypothetical protein
MKPLTPSERDYLSILFCRGATLEPGRIAQIVEIAIKLGVDDDLFQNANLAPLRREIKQRNDYANQQASTDSNAQHAA